MTIRVVRLELARDHDFPLGSDSRGYELHAPLTEDGHIDAEGWRKHRKNCKVRRFWVGEDDEIGHLRHTQGGTWTFHYDETEADLDDEPGFKFESRVFKVGEYVSVREHDGTLRTFKVVSVR